MAGAIAANTEKEEWPELLQDAAPVLQPVLRDRARPQPDTTDTPIELEYAYLRVCDQAYMLLRNLENPFFDETVFRLQNDEERDVEIRKYSGRRDLPVA